MTTENEFAPIEQKLTAYFDSQRDSLRAPQDLFDRLTSRLPEQDRPRWWRSIVTNGRTDLKLVVAGLATVLVAAVGVATWQLDLVTSGSDANAPVVPAGLYGKPGEPGTSLGPAGQPGPAATAAPAPTAAPAATATAAPALAPLGVPGETVVVTSSAPVETSGPPPQPVVVTATPPAAGAGALTLDQVLAEAGLTGGYSITEGQYRALIAQAQADGIIPEDYELPPGGFSDTFFQNYGVNPYVSTTEEPFSTFAMDVDTASYTLTRGWLQAGQVPPPDAIRVEEFVNYFDQDYPDAAGVFEINVDGAPSPFHDDGRTLLRVGVSGQDIALDDRRVANITFVIDTSGSMGRDNRLGLVKRAITKLVDNLHPGDRIGIVEYGSTARKLLDPTTDVEAVKGVVNSLIDRGSTNAEHGLRLGYEMATAAYEEGKINRIILMSDGVANVGETDADVLLQQIKETARGGITLSTIGVGLDNYNDVLMERLANHGDGNYAYVDSDAEAGLLFGNGLTGLLEVIATEAKIQVEFNPAAVQSYRLLGYENRALTSEQFRDDSVDAGEVGAGHTVTAVYELRLAEAPETHVGDVRVRYADPDTLAVTEIEAPIALEAIQPYADGSHAFHTTAAAAMFAEILRESPFATDVTLLDLRASLQTVVDENPGNAKARELLSLMQIAESLSVTGYIPAPE